MVAAKIANMERGGDKPSERDSNFDSANLPNGKISQDQAAQMLNVSSRSVRTAKEVIKKDPEKAKEVESGKKSVSKARKEIKDKEEKHAAPKNKQAPTGRPAEIPDHLAAASGSGPFTSE